MRLASGFSFVHNALEGGYPIVEAIKAVADYVGEVVIVDMQSTDGTREVLDKLGVRILDGVWEPGTGGECLAKAHAMNTRCYNETIIHFEADEVYDGNLICKLAHLVGLGIDDINVFRLQLEQNFQRCRWYPERVHRVFRRGSVNKVGHTTDRYEDAVTAGQDIGYLWDITNCFRDNWVGRVSNQAELWGGYKNLIHVPAHITHPADMLEPSVVNFLSEEHWVWRQTPFAIPPILLPLVGMTKYEVNL